MLQTRAGIHTSKVLVTSSTTITKPLLGTSVNAIFSCRNGMNITILCQDSPTRFNSRRRHHLSVTLCFPRALPVTGEYVELSMQTSCTILRLTSKIRPLAC